MVTSSAAPEFSGIGDKSALAWMHLLLAAHFYHFTLILRARLCRKGMAKLRTANSLLH